MFIARKKRFLTLQVTFSAAVISDVVSGGLVLQVLIAIIINTLIQTGQLSLERDSSIIFIPIERVPVS